MRARAQQLATLELGQRSERDIRLALQRDVQQKRFTQIDRWILHRAQDGVLDLNHPSRTPYGRFQDRLIKERLHSLSGLQASDGTPLATQTRSNIWKLSPLFEKSLRELGMHNDILKTRHRFMAQDKDAAFGILNTNQPRSLQGRVVHRDLADELSDREFIWVKSENTYYYVSLHRNSERGRTPVGAHVKVTVTKGKHRNLVQVTRLPDLPKPQFPAPGIRPQTERIKGRDR